MADLVILYFALGWVVAVLVDIAQAQIEPPFYHRIIPLWPVVLVALVLVWVSDRLGIES